MRDHWGVDRHPGKHSVGKWYYYFLYSLERAGILDDVRLVKGRDGYYEGALQLLERQRRDGSWDESGHDYVPETCFAFLFLKRATSPITPR